VKIRINRIALLALTFLLGSIAAYAQGPTGTYEGMVKMPNGAEQKLSLELKSEGSKVTGQAKHGDQAKSESPGRSGHHKVPTAPDDNGSAAD